jgi:hypothetical protein
MKRFIVVAMLLASFSLYADPAPATAPIPEAAKAEMLQYLQELLRDGDITQKQHDEMLVWIASNPCKSIDRSRPSDERKKELVAAFAEQLKMPATDIEDSFASEGWSIHFVSHPHLENQYLFYSGDPTKAAKPITEFSGSGPFYETSEIEKWVLENAPGIPRGLAACFAWHFTLGGRTTSGSG